MVFQPYTITLHVMKLPMAFCTCFLVFMSACAASLYAQKPDTPHASPAHNQNFVPLITRLVRDGFDKDYLTSIFQDPRAHFLPDILYTNLTVSYREADYSRFASGRSVRQAREFLTEESDFLNDVEKRFQVEKEIIVSILYIESAFGRNAGTNRVVNVFSTLSLAARPDILASVTERIVDAYPHISRSAIEQRARKKSEWAYEELKTLLSIARHEKRDVFTVVGSWAGAFGMFQFVPTSYARFALDGNNDGTVSLHDRYDAITSVANYLKRHGWTMEADYTRKKALLRKYNNSNAYAEAVFRLARLIRDHGQSR